MNKLNKITLDLYLPSKITVQLVDEQKSNGNFIKNM